MHLLDMCFQCSLLQKPPFKHMPDSLSEQYRQVCAAILCECNIISTSSVLISPDTSLPDFAYPPSAGHVEGFVLHLVRGRSFPASAGLRMISSFSPQQEGFSKITAFQSKGRYQTLFIAHYEMDQLTSCHFAVWKSKY